MITLNAYGILIVMSLIVMASYLFDGIAKALRLPSVIMLLATGIGLKYLTLWIGIEFGAVDKMLEVLGIVGLILIVLEGALDLKISRETLPLIKASFLSALIVFGSTSILVAVLLQYMMHIPFLNALVFAIPLSVISSAIAIPSAKHLNEQNRMFVIYESTFSDILGITFFNFLAFQTHHSLHGSLFSLISNVILMIIISLICCVALLFFIQKSKSHVKFFLIFSFLILIYALGKLAHLSSLILILIFGLMMKNSNLYLRGKLSIFLDQTNLKETVSQLSLVTAESAFLVRTFFFILFGYSIDLKILADNSIIIVGISVMSVITLVRLIYLLLIAKRPLVPELFMAPRGLITVLLFYSIPTAFGIASWGVGLVLFIIILSNIQMMIGLSLSQKSNREV